MVCGHSLIKGTLITSRLSPEANAACEFSSQACTHVHVHESNGIIGMQ